MGPKFEHEPSWLQALSLDLCDNLLRKLHDVTELKERSLNLKEWMSTVVTGVIGSLKSQRPVSQSWLCALPADWSGTNYLTAPSLSWLIWKLRHHCGDLYNFITGAKRKEKPDLGIPGIMRCWCRVVWGGDRPFHLYFAQVFLQHRAEPLPRDSPS
jgi:hypothetical protein